MAVGLNLSVLQVTDVQMINKYSHWRSRWLTSTDTGWPDDKQVLTLDDQMINKYSHWRSRWLTSTHTGGPDD